MSRMYRVPPDTRVKEKVIGGVLTLAQAGWIAMGLVLGLLVFVLTFYVLGGALALILAFFFSLTGLPFAFYKKEQLTLYQYLKYKRQFEKKTKYLPNKRKEVIKE